MLSGPAFPSIADALFQQSMLGFVEGSSMEESLIVRPQK